jgi:hypothetical protein
MYKDL